MIHFSSKEFYQFQQIVVLDFKIARIGFFQFIYRKYTYEVCYNLLIGINPRSLPLRNEQIPSTQAPSCPIYTTPQQKTRILVEQNKVCRAKSPFISR